LNSSRRSDTELIAVSVDSRDLLQTMANKIEKDGMKADFLFLSDAGHKVIDRYGLLNPAGQGWPHPTTYVVDRKGVVRWKFTEINYKIRPTNVMILEALDRVKKEAR
jgi:peroxiredoxin